MALIKCSGCGHMISDKASKCPKCGCTQAEKKQRPDVPQHESRQAESHPGYYNEEDKSYSQIVCPIASRLEDETKNNKLKKGKGSPWWLIGAIVVIIFLSYGGYYTYQYYNRTSIIENIEMTFEEDSFLSEDVVNKDCKPNNDQFQLELVGDADGFPLKLTLDINYKEVTGMYKNVKYGTTMKVKGTIENGVIELTGSADLTTYVFHIVNEGDMFIGSFGRIDGKPLKLHFMKQ